MFLYTGGCANEAGEWVKVGVIMHGNASLFDCMQGFSEVCHYMSGHCMKDYRTGRLFETCKSSLMAVVEYLRVRSI